MGMLEAAKSSSGIYLLRHGNTAMDVLSRSDGWIDFPLSDKGRMGLIEAQQCLKGVPIKYIYAPTLKRTTETAEIIASGLISCPKVVPSDDARTWNLGILMGTLKKPNKPIVSYFMKHPKEKPIGGESLSEFRKRFLPWIKERKKEVAKDKSTILIVLSGSNLRELGIQMYDDKIVLDLNEGGLALMTEQGGKWTARVIFGHKDDEDERIS